MKDSDALERYRRVLIELWYVTGYIQWGDGALRRLAEHLPNAGVKLIHELMHDHAISGGKIDQVEEMRPEYVCWRFHYDLRLPVTGQRFYIETVFDDCPDIKGALRNNVVKSADDDEHGEHREHKGHRDPTTDSCSGKGQRILLCATLCPRCSPCLDRDAAGRQLCRLFLCRP